MALTLSKKINQKTKKPKPMPLDAAILPLAPTSQTGLKEDIVISHSWHALRQIMWDYVGIARNQRRLIYAQKQINAMHAEIDAYYHNSPIKPDLVECRNLICIASHIINAALFRCESRGLHYREDYPKTNPKWHNHNTIICKAKGIYVKPSTNIPQDTALISID